MQELVKITEQNGKQAVSARELHTFLESKQQFSNWIRNRIKKYGLIENQDYIVFNKFIKNLEGGRPLDEYALTLDCAKELAMVEGNLKCKQARQYFIECEKKLREVTQRQIGEVKDLKTIEAKIMVARFYLEVCSPNENSKLMLMHSIANPVGLDLPDYTTSKDVLRSASELLKINNIGMNTRQLNQLLLQEGILTENSRPSNSKAAKDGKSYFKTLTEKGLEYGENQSSIHNPKETQPLYYENKFMDLLKLLNLL
ncbi:antA/AntB antirepressor family protein [Apibacter muscae]|uniref:antA/AntB antirepressor family protein n=1 Tax=Apibacter muscae TaxID=2509004 RepID=UPI001FE92023|nr:antA/AntB antirepressor family protein [Apibacter muscae]